MPTLPWLPVVSASSSHKLSTMIEPFLGTWKLVSSENFEDYMKELGETHHYGTQEFVAKDFGVGAGFVPHNDIFFLVSLGYIYMRQYL